MRRGALLFEVFPYKYFKNSYLNLAATYGVRYKWVQDTRPTSLSRALLYLVPQDLCMKFNRCRSHARGDSVVMTHDHLAAVVAAIREIELADEIVREIVAGIREQRENFSTVSY
jgi:hypothetical protein